ncbi:MAG: hypothetical protein E4H20_03725, partial [Spirochaetales bacterium]
MPNAPRSRTRSPAAEAKRGSNNPSEKHSPVSGLDHAAQTKVLLDISREVSENLELDAVLETIAKRAFGLMTKDTVAVYT